MPKSNRPEISYLVQTILPRMTEQYGFPAPDDEVRTKIDEIPVRVGSGTQKPDTVYYHNGVPVLLIEAKREGKSEEDAVGQALSYIRNFPVKKYSKDNLRPRFFAVSIGRRVTFYAHRFGIEGNNLIDGPEKLEAPLYFQDLLKKCGLVTAEKKEILTAEAFRKEVLNELAAIYFSDRITPGVVQNVSEQVLAFLEYGRDFTGHRPYLDLEKHKDREEQIRHLYEKIDWPSSLGQDVAREFRSYILRAFQGTNLNQYLTEQCVIAFMMNLVGGIGPETRVLDFECGSGGFLAATVERGATLENIFGIDIDELPYSIAKTYLALYFRKTSKEEIDALPVRHSNGLFYWGKDWDAVIGNPAGSNRYEHGDLEKIGEHLDRDLDHNGQMDDNLSEYNLSIQQAVVSAKVGGKICLVLPEGFFSNSQDDVLRIFVAKHCKVLAIVSLPRGIFKKGFSTRRQGGGAQVATMKMSILFAEKSREVNRADPISGDGVADLGYPVFLGSVSEPESKGGPVCEWLEPRLAVVLEQWEEWQRERQLKSTSTIKLEVKVDKKKRTAIGVPTAESKSKTAGPSTTKRARIQPKTETKISKTLGDVFDP